MRISVAEIALIALVILILLAVVAASAAQRVDRLHRRVARTRAALSSVLLERAHVASRFATSAVLDPASAVVLEEAAWQAQEAGRRDGALDDMLLGPGQAEAERSLGEALRAVIGEAPEQEALAATAGGRHWLDAIARANYRVILAQQFFNDAVTATVRLRRAWPVLAFRLAGRSPMPRISAIDDQLPQPAELAPLTQTEEEGPE